MQAKFAKEVTAATTHVSPPPALSKAQKRIAKIEERQQKLDAARAKATKELADEQRCEIVAAGRAEFLAALESLDLTTREMVVSNVLQATEDLSRRNKIQAWVAVIAEPKPHKNGLDAEDKLGHAGRTGMGAGSKIEDDGSSDSAPFPNAGSNSAA